MQPGTRARVHVVRRGVDTEHEVLHGMRRKGYAAGARGTRNSADVKPLEELAIKSEQYDQGPAPHPTGNPYPCDVLRCGVGAV